MPLYALIVYTHHSFFCNGRCIRCQKEQRQYSRFGTGWSCRPKFTSLNYVPAANPWIASLFSATKIGVVLRISWSNSRNSGILHGVFIVQSRHPCMDPANEKLPGVSSVIKMMLTNWACLKRTRRRRARAPAPPRPRALAAPPARALLCSSRRQARVRRRRT